jgi:hypothetical protein
MKLLGVIGTTGLFLLLGTTAAYAAQDRPDQDKPDKQDAKPEAKAEAKPAAKPEAKPEAKSEAKPEAKSEAKPAKQQQSADKSQSGGGAHGRISDAHYNASFGSGHNFHVSQGDYNNHRFSYGGYSFGFIDAWPVGWGYSDNVYVIYDGGVYYMYDVVHPGIRISLNFI